MEKINPRVDLAFKKIFGTEENKDLLISLINSTVGEEDQVIDVTLLNPYNQKNFKQDKLSILDIKAEGACGKKFNIEIFYPCFCTKESLQILIERQHRMVHNSAHEFVQSFLSGFQEVCIIFVCEVLCE